MFNSKLTTYKITANKSARTFTLRSSTGFKYRTFKMSKDEFKSCEYNTQQDWREFLKTDEYSAIK